MNQITENSRIEELEKINAALVEALQAAFPAIHYYGHKPGEQHVNATPSRCSVGYALDLIRPAWTLAEARTNT